MLTQETKRHIDAARQVLVGVVPNPATQIDQITNALIYKFMDDMDQQSIRAGGDSSFFKGDLEKYAWTRLMDSRVGNQERMNLYSEALIKFSESSQLPALFREIFRSTFLPYRSPEVLDLFLKEIAYFDYSHSEELGNAYEYLLSIMSSQGDAGQFRTPRHIIDFMVEVVNPTKDDKVLDPACGTAGFLISAFKYIRAQHDGKKEDGSKHEEKPLTPDERRTLMGNFEGYDIDPGMVRISQVNMYLHGFSSPKIFQYDSLSMEDRWSDKFDVILANPPFMTPKGGIRPHSKFGIKSSRSEVLFVEYIVSHLKPGGRCAIIVPDGVVTRSGSAYSNVRKLLLSEGLWAVVDLPAGLFAPYSNVKTSILILDKKINTDKILFTKVMSQGVNTAFEVSHTTELNTRDILHKLCQGRDGLMKEDHEVQWLSKNLVLNSSEAFLRYEYYGVAHEEQEWGWVALGDLIEKSGQKVGSQSNVPVMSITMQHGLVDQSQKFKKRIANVDIAKYKLVKRDELVVGFPIDEGVLGFQRSYDFAAVSPAYDVWKIKRSDVPVEYLEQILRSKEAIKLFKSSMKGTANRRRVVPKEVFLSLRIPLPSFTEVQSVSKNIEDIKIKNKELLKKVERNDDEIRSKISELWEVE